MRSFFQKIKYLVTYKVFWTGSVLGLVLGVSEYIQIAEPFLFLSSYAVALTALVIGFLTIRNSKDNISTFNQVVRISFRASRNMAVGLALLSSVVIITVSFVDGGFTSLVNLGLVELVLSIISAVLGFTLGFLLSLLWIGIFAIAGGVAGWKTKRV
jgi:hypothetical protein